MRNLALDRRRTIVIGAVVAVAAGLAIGLPLGLNDSAGSAMSRHTTPHHIDDPSDRRRAHPAGSRIAARDGSAVELVADAPAPRPAPAGTKALASAEQRFSLALLKQLSSARDDSSHPTNVTVSPASLGLALAMLEHGAAGRTRSEIERVLQSTGMSPDQQGAGWAALQKQWTDPSSKVTLESANSIWDQQGFAPSPVFLAALERYYSAGVWQADFAQDNAHATDALNRWVSRHTHGKIPTLFDELPVDTQAVLANALYFKAEWQQQFDPSDTSPGLFTTSDDTIKTDFMHAQLHARVAVTDGCTAVELPYQGGRFAALAVLPEHGSLSDLVDGMTTDRLSSITDAMTPTDVELALPKFTTTSTLDLNQTLRKLGMTTAFTDAADFTNLSKRSLKISAVVQKDYLAVAEKGTEAAAATGAVLVPTAARPVGQTISFDHPFLFLVRDTRTGAILFGSLVQRPGTS